MSRDSHISALKNRLEGLEAKIRQGLLHLSVDDLEIEKLKRQRLRVKERIDLEERKTL